jgi:hypothetical protein
MLRRALPVLLTVAGAAVIAPASGNAAIIEVGKLATEHPPSCPSSPCLAVSRTTGYQAKVGTDRGLFVVPQDGKIVAWSITLGRPGPRQTRFFESRSCAPAGGCSTA